MARAPKSGQASELICPGCHHRLVYHCDNPACTWRFCLRCHQVYEKLFRRWRGWMG